MLPFSCHILTLSDELIDFSFVSLSRGDLWVTKMGLMGNICVSIFKMPYCLSALLVPMQVSSYAPWSCVEKSNVEISSLTRNSISTWCWNNMFSPAIFFQIWPSNWGHVMWFLIWVFDDMQLVTQTEQRNTNGHLFVVLQCSWLWYDCHMKLSSLLAANTVQAIISLTPTHALVLNYTKIT